MICIFKFALTLAMYMFIGAVIRMKDAFFNNMYLGLEDER
jgi:hypothetical protein